jgi:hypothetical protein
MIVSSPLLGNSRDLIKQYREGAVGNYGPIP